MNNFFWTLAGESFINPKIHSEKAQIKYSRIGASLLIPMVLWFAMGYFFIVSFTENSPLTGVMTGLLLALIILALDRFILTLSGGTWQILLLRLALAIIPSILNAIVVDMHLFEKDIAPMVETYRTEQLRSTYENQSQTKRFQLDELNIRIGEAKRKVEILQQEYFAEMDGDGGSGRGGYGRIARRKEAAMNTAMQSYQTLVDQRDDLNAELDAEWSAVMEEQLAEKPGILVQITVFKDFVKDNPAALSVFLLFFALVCLLELIPMFSKMFMKDTDYDRWKESNDQQSQQRIADKDHQANQRSKRLKTMTETDHYIQSVLEESPLS